MNIPGLTISWMSRRISTETIVSDMCYFYQKYFWKCLDDDQQESNLLYVTFISDEGKKRIESRLMNLTNDHDPEIINVFDGAIKECNDVLQLLYREYVIDT